MAILNEQVVTIRQESPAYPEVLLKWLGSDAPAEFWAAGPLKALDQPKTGFFCSSQCPGSIVLKTFDAITKMRGEGQILIGGFHSVMEWECLGILLRGRQPVIWVPARSIVGMHLKPELLPAFNAGRLLILSPFAALVFRLLGAVLTAYLLWAATRTDSISSEGSFIGAPAEIVAAVAAFCVGWYVIPVKPLAGPLAAQAAGIALVVLALGPLAGKHLLRSGVAIAVMALGISLLMEAWTLPSSSLDQILTTTVMVGIVGATGLLVSPADGELGDGGGEPDGLGEIGELSDDVPATADPDFEPQESLETGRARRLGVREPRR